VDAARAAARHLAAALAAMRAGLARRAGAVILYRTLGTVVMVPLIVLFGRWALARGGDAGLSDADIATYLLATPRGALTLLLFCALLIAVVGIEQAGLIGLGVVQATGGKARVRDAFAHAFTRAFPVLRFTALLTLRVAVIAAPFLAVIGAAYWLLLTAHDINYYLSAKPAEFWEFAAVAAVVLLLLGAFLARQCADWVLALPIIVFEGVLPYRAFGESARRMQGRKVTAAFALFAWGAIAFGFSALVSALVREGGRASAGAFDGSMPAMVAFLGLFGVVWLVASFASAILTAALFAEIVVRLYVEQGVPSGATLPRAYGGALELEGRRLRLSWPAVLGATVLLFAGSTVVMVLLLRSTVRPRPVLVFAHRGASVEAPENTLPAFSRAIDEHADFIELDVQESADGVVLVNHDEDLMKLARSPLKIWQTPAAQLQAVDMGSSHAPPFPGTHVPALADVLSLAKGRVKVDIELKDYGHDVALEERVTGLVEAAGMVNEIVTMSLNPKMVEKMKSIRPQWTSGLLAAKAVGSPAGLPGDFLAVQKGTATRSFIRRAHAAGKPVYVWTVDDPAQMVYYIGLGVDGIITDRPALAKDVVERYEAMTPVERLYAFAMIRMGGNPEVADNEDQGRP